MSKLIRNALAGTLPLVILALPAQAGTPRTLPAPDGAHAPPIPTEPVPGVYNQSWYNYVADINEADKELTSDLKRPTARTGPMHGRNTRSSWPMPTRITSRKCASAATRSAA